MFYTLCKNLAKYKNFNMSNVYYTVVTVNMLTLIRDTIEKNNNSLS